MQTVKLTVADERKTAIENAIANIEKGNKQASEAKKLCDAGKEYLAKLLADERKIEVAKLEIGEIVAVSINGTAAFNVVIGKQNRLDSAALMAERPEIMEQFKREFATVSFKRAA